MCAARALSSPLRKPRPRLGPYGRRLLAGTGAGLSATTLALLCPTPAAAAAGATAAQWQRVAACESSGNWAADTGNGYYGGLQISLSTWDAYGGSGYAPSPDEATAAEQMAIANRILAGQGWGAWPVCSRDAGASTGTTSAPAPAAPAPAVTVDQPTSASRPGAARSALVLAIRNPMPKARKAFVVHPGATGPGHPSLPPARPGSWERVNSAQVDFGGAAYVLPPGRT